MILEAFLDPGCRAFQLGSQRSLGTSGFHLTADGSLRCSELALGAKGGLMRRHKSRSLDHLVDAAEQG
jgi:hypothetical protein